MNTDLKVLILATSYAPELRNRGEMPNDCPRTDYVELSKRVDSKIIDYTYYDASAGFLSSYRKLESRLRLDCHMAAMGYRMSSGYDAVMLMSERIAIPYMFFQRCFGKRTRSVYVSAHSSEKQAKIIRSLGLFNGLDVAVSNTHAQRDFFVNEVGIPENRILYAMYAADQKYYTPGDAPDEGYIFSAGGIRGRDYPTLFEAVYGLPVKVKVAAGGRSYGPKAVKKLPPIPENVEMLAPTDSAGMREHYRRAKIVVVPLSSSRKDAAGCSVVLEAMCCGKSVIASRTKGMEDYLIDGHSGIMVEPENPEHMRASILQIMDDVATAERLSSAARKECEGRLSMESLVDGLEKSVYIACEADQKRSID